MSRTRQILSRGWLGKTLSVLTFGYFSVRRLAQGYVCPVLTLLAPSGLVEMFTSCGDADVLSSAGSVDLFVPVGETSIRVSSGVVEIEDCCCG